MCLTSPDPAFVRSVAPSRIWIYVYRYEVVHHLIAFTWIIVNCIGNVSRVDYYHQFKLQR